MGEAPQDMEDFQRAYSRLCKDSGAEPQDSVLQQLHELPRGRLDLAAQSLTVDTCRALGKLLQSALLRELVLSDCMLSEEGGQAQSLLGTGACPGHLTEMSSRSPQLASSHTVVCGQGSLFFWQLTGWHCNRVSRCFQRETSGETHTVNLGQEGWGGVQSDRGVSLLRVWDVAYSGAYSKGMQGTD